MLPDWAIFKRFGWQIFFQKWPKCMKTFRLFWKYQISSKNCHGYILGNFLENYVFFSFHHLVTLVLILYTYCLRSAYTFACLDTFEQIAEFQQSLTLGNCQLFLRTRNTQSWKVSFWAHKLRLPTYLHPVWPDWALYWTLGILLLFYPNLQHSWTIFVKV